MSYLLVQNNTDDDGRVAAWCNLPPEIAELWLDFEFVVYGAPPAGADVGWRGPWTDLATYATDDRVTHTGGTWEAPYPMPAGVEPGNPSRPPDSIVQANLHGVDIMASDRLAASSWVTKFIKADSPVSDDTLHKSVRSMIDMNVDSAFQVNIANDHPTSALEVRVYDEAETTKATYSIAANSVSGDLALGTTTPATGYIDRFIFCSFADDSAGSYRIKVKPSTSMRNLTNPPSFNTVMGIVRSVRCWTYNRINWTAAQSVHIGTDADLTDISNRPAVPLVVDRSTTSSHTITLKNNHPSQNLNVAFYNISQGLLGVSTPNPIPSGATATFATDSSSGDIFGIAYFGSGSDPLVAGDFDVSLTNVGSLAAPPAKIIENLEWLYLGDGDLGPPAPHLFEFYRDNFNLDATYINPMIARASLGAATGGYKWDLQVGDMFASGGFAGVGATYLVRLHIFRVGGLFTAEWGGSLAVNGLFVHSEVLGELPNPLTQVGSFVLRPAKGAHDTRLQINWIKAGREAGGAELFRANYDRGDAFP